ncbi:MAG: MFS transporter [Steroidobacteraceae bacterium]|nr:MFS transporter [Steroidobacteraceae bacterium]MDW8259412.1 MFS transporter [Gammaproteobacteria bacterium]
MHSAEPSERQAGFAQGLVLSLATFLPILATLSIAPAIPRLIEHFADVANVNVLVPMLISVPAAFIALTAPFVGIPIRRFGRKPVLVCGVVLYGLFGTAPFFLDDLLAILATRAGVGVAEAMLATVGKSLIGDYFAGERRQRWVGYQNAIDAVLGTGMWFVGGLVASFGWRAPFLLYLVALPLLVAVLWLIWEPRPVPADVAADATAANGGPFPWRRMLIVYAVTVFSGAMYFSYPTNIARALTELGVASPVEIGILTAVASVGTPLGALLFARATTLSIPVVLGVGLALIGLPFIGIGLAGHPQLAMGIGFFEQIGNGLLGAVLTMWCLRCLPFEHRGQGMGIWQSCLVAGIFISPLLFAYLEHLTGSILHSFVALGAVCAASAAVIPVLVRRTMPAEVLSSTAPRRRTDRR